MTSLNYEDIFSSHRDIDVNVSFVAGVLLYVRRRERDVHAPIEGKNEIISKTKYEQ